MMEASTICAPQVRPPSASGRTASVPALRQRNDGGAVTNVMRITRISLAKRIAGRYAVSP